MTDKERTAASSYRILIGLHYVPNGGADEVRVEVGDVVNDFNPKSIKALKELGAIEEVKFSGV